MTDSVCRLLIIAGSDSSGGAGIQTDIATSRLMGVYPATTVSCITSQNSRGLRMIQPASPEIFRDQIESCLDDYTPDAVKVGMIPVESHIRILTDIFSSHRLENIVVDPVMASTAGGNDNLWREMWRNPDLIAGISSYVDLFTPNIPEFAVWSQSCRQNSCNDFDPSDWEAVSRTMRFFSMRNLLLKGGHDESRNGFSTDILVQSVSGNFEFSSISRRRLESRNTHGTGCTLSTAIACRLAKGDTLYDAVKNAGDFLWNLLDANRNIKFYENGHGPVII